MSTENREYPQWIKDADWVSETIGELWRIMRYGHGNQLARKKAEKYLQKRLNAQRAKYFAAPAPNVVASPAPAPQRGKFPIDRPCSACGDGDTAMEHHDHDAPFRAGYGPRAEKETRESK